MARYSVGCRTASTASATLPAMSLYSAASVNFRLREIGITNTTTTAVCVGLCRLAGTGTQGTALTEFNLDNDGTTSSCQAFNTHTVTVTTLTDAGYRATLGAAAGSGFVFTFANDVGLKQAAGTTNGAGVYIPTGSGQVCDIYFTWDE